MSTPAESLSPAISPQAQAVVAAIRKLPTPAHTGSMLLALNDTFDAGAKSTHPLITRLLDLLDTIRDDSEGRYPRADSGCVECTHGATLDRLNTGRCAYHEAKRLVGEA